MALYYLTFVTYDGLESLKLNPNLACNQKSLYIIEKLQDLDIPFEVISLAETGYTQLKYFAAKSVHCGRKGKCTVWGTFGKPNGAFRRLHLYYRLWQLNKFLSKLTADDIVIVYHSLITDKLLVQYHKKIGFKLILELEEIYQDVVPCSSQKKKFEKEIIEQSDGYILSTDSLRNKIPATLPSIVVNGTYKVEPVKAVPTQDGLVHVVYAGTLDPRKGGAIAAAAAAYLPFGYHIHLLGFGTKDQIKYLENQIQQVQQKTKCKVTFDGLKTGEEYIRFLQTCHIGLSTQNPDAAFNATSFPSKILSYLANGLHVVSIRIPVVEESAVSDLLTYYDKQTPQEIANAIMSVDLKTSYDSRTRLQQLDKKFQEDLQKVLNHFSHETFN